jgi:membrane peptidoglycan carboxypeptidase
VFTTVANGGTSVPPRLVSATIDSDGARHEQPAPAGHRVVSAKTAAELNEMLRGVVTGGTGTQAQISGYTVAGKTGTSRKPGNGVDRPQYMASFAGFAPAESPRLAAIVVIDQPGTNDEAYFGGKVAAPLFSRIMQYALRLEHVAPTTMMSAEASDPGPRFDAVGPKSSSKVASSGESTSGAPKGTGTTAPQVTTSLATPGAVLPAGNVSQPVP